jgi:hypothetical protein
MSSTSTPTSSTHTLLRVVAATAIVVLFGLVFLAFQSRQADSGRAGDCLAAQVAAGGYSSSPSCR